MQGVARKRWGKGESNAAALVVVLAIGLLLPSASAAQCERKMETSSPMFGAAWADTFVLYTQDYNWKVSGDISKVNLYYGETEGCLKGVKTQYGADPANAQRLGVETKALLVRSLQLKPGERIVRAEYKAAARCIKYLSLRTNQGRQLAVGQHDSPTPTAFAAPTNPTGYLGYINGHTAKPMSNPHVGKLMQLQLVWAACDDAPASTSSSGSSVSAAAVSAGGQKKKKAAKGSGVKVSLASMPSTTSSSSSSGEDTNSMQEQQAGPKCGGNHLCKDGKCATSSCSLAGLGADVPNLMCYGTNMRLPFLNSGLDVSPCSFLACKLDTASCTSSGLMGVGGFCTGKVVSMGAAAMLHPQGKQWLGYPCVEHKSSGLGLRAGMLGEMTSAEDMVAKSWKVCDCVKKAPLRNSLAMMLPNGTITSYIFGKSSSSSSGGGGGGGQQQQQQQQKQEPTVAVPLMPVYEMGIKDVVTQWLAAKAGNAALPTAAISTQLAADLKQLVPGFMTPSLLIANTSEGLMTRPEWMSEVPVFVLPNSALSALKAVLPDLTALPTLALGPNMTTADATALLEMPQHLLVSDITVDVLPALASKLGLPTFLKLNPSTSTNKVDSRSDVGPHLVPLDQMHIGNAVVQWATAVSRKAPLPTLVLKTKEDLARLQAKVPGLVTPSVVVPNISYALMFKPQETALPLFVLPSELSAEVMAVLPDVTSLPSYLVLADQAKEKLPELSLMDFIAPNMRVLLDTLGPSIPLLLKQVSNLSGPSGLNLTDNPALQSLMVGPWGQLLSGIPEMVADASTSIDVVSINEVLGAVKAALETSGFKLPYLTMTDDTLQKWGMKKIEGFVTNVVTRAVTPREDPSLIEEDEEEEAADEDSDEWHPPSRSSSSSKRNNKRRHRKSHPAGDTNPEALHTAQKHTKVAAVLSALKQEEALQQDTKPAASKKQPKQKQQPQLQGEEKDQAGDDEEDEQQEEADQGAASGQQQQQGKKAAQKPAASSPVPVTLTSVEPEADQPSSTATDAKPASGKDREPPSKPAYSPTSAAASTPATPAAASAPAGAAATVPTKPAKDAATGVPVPTTPAGARPSPVPASPKTPTPSQVAAEAEKQRAAAAAKAAAERQAQLDRAEKEALGRRQAAAAADAAAKANAIPVGTEDEDGAVVIDMADAKRAFMTVEQWEQVTEEHKDKLLKLLLANIEQT